MNMGRIEVQPGASVGVSVSKALSLCLTGPAKADHGKMARIDCEPEVGDSSASKVREEALIDLDVGVALLADQVPMCCASQVIGRRAVPEMGVHDHAESFELLKVAVDGRDRHVRCVSLDLRRELLGSSVP